MYYRIRVENREKWLFSVYNVFFLDPRKIRQKSDRKNNGQKREFSKKKPLAVGVQVS